MLFWPASSHFPLSTACKLILELASDSDCELRYCRYSANSSYRQAVLCASRTRYERFEGKARNLGFCTDWQWRRNGDGCSRRFGCCNRGAPYPSNWWSTLTVHASSSTHWRPDNQLQGPTFPISFILQQPYQTMRKGRCGITILIWMGSAGQLCPRSWRR